MLLPPLGRINNCITEKSIYFEKGPVIILKKINKQNSSEIYIALVCYDTTSNKKTLLIVF